VREGHFVRVLDNLDPQVHGNDPDPASRLAPAVEFRRGDIRDLETTASALEDIDVVYHFAAATGVTQSMFQVERYIDINVRGTATLWDAIINRGTKLRKFILASSRAVYGEGSYWCATCQSHVYPTMRSPAQLSRANGT
jgi:dTDP-L-rhamnose 4-epimerase